MELGRRLAYGQAVMEFTAIGTAPKADDSYRRSDRRSGSLSNMTPAGQGSVRSMSSIHSATDRIRPLLCGRASTTSLRGPIFFSVMVLSQSDRMRSSFGNQSSPAHTDERSAQSASPVHQPSQTIFGVRP